ncbi:MAG: plasmid recombination protein [Methylotenera sp.]|nr:plasmid recombination protein [Flavobacterium sp.]
MYAIIRKRKHKSISSIKTRENHTYRRESTPNADPEKLHKNKLLYGVESYGIEIESQLKNYEQSGKNIRTNAVLSIEYLLTASPEFFHGGTKNEREERLKKWCDAQIEFVKKEHGEKNIACMYLHLDEKTPHIEVFVVPIDPKGKLNCKHFLGPRNALSMLQTRYSAHNKDFGLKRGAKGSKATHQQVQKFYEQIKQPAKVNNENLQKAVKLEAPTIKHILNPEVYLAGQEAKIVSQVARLFANTIYENKLIQQAKKILTNWKRVEDDNIKMQYKLEGEKEALQDKINRQTKAIEQLEKLQINNKDLQKNLTNALIENQLLKNSINPSKLKL